jgi:sRNA-binding regulator protein Hfq
MSNTNLTTTTANASESAQNLTKFVNTNKMPLKAGFLHGLKLTNQETQIFLVNGIKLTSAVVGHNEKFVLILNQEKKLNLVNWTAISTVSASGKSCDKVDIDLDGESLEKASLKVLCESEVNTFLLNGIKLSGRIEAFDESAIYLSATDKRGQVTNQIIQLDSIASISPETSYDKTQKEERSYNN